MHSFVVYGNTQCTAVALCVECGARFVLQTLMQVIHDSAWFNICTVIVLVSIYYSAVITVRMKLLRKVQELKFRYSIVLFSSGGPITTDPAIGPIRAEKALGKETIFK